MTLSALGTQHLETEPKTEPEERPEIDMEGLVGNVILRKPRGVTVLRRDC